MVATYVEIIVGARFTDKEACEKFLGMTEEEYKKLTEDFGNGVFFECCNREKSLLPKGYEFFMCRCCSETGDMILGISLRKLYLVDKECDGCKCFGTTEQGFIDFDSTYSFKYKLNPFEVCDNCNSYNKNGKAGERCRTCNYALKPYSTWSVGNTLKRKLEIEREVNIYFHWDDCSSCS